MYTCITINTYIQPKAVAFDLTGSIYFADQFSHRIRMVSTSGIITTIAGTGGTGLSGDGGQATSATLFYPAATTFYNGNLLICDKDNNVIRKLVLSTGIITTIAGSSTGALGYLNGPSSSALFNS